tara:strand:+ start:1351 stop:1560 length:210 start_codon:yes stop_codon:yes gene_type:complete
MNKECCEYCKKKIKIIDKQKKLIDKLQKDRDAWASKHWELVGENCRLEDILGALKVCDSKIIKGILLKD